MNLITSRAVIGAYYARLDTNPGLAWVNGISNLFNSDQESETYAWLGQSPALREWVGGRHAKGFTENGITIRNKHYESTLEVALADVRRDKSGQIMARVSDFADRAQTHWASLLSTLLINGASALCYDGQYFFDTDHVGYDDTGAEVSVSNMQAGAATPWYLLSARNFIKPLIFQKRRNYQFVPKDSLTDDNVFDKNEFVYGVDARVNAGYGLWQLAHGSKAALDATTYDAARTAMASLRGPNGKSLGITGDLLVVPPALEGTAKRLLTAEKEANGADNIWRGTAELLMVPDLA